MSRHESIWRQSAEADLYAPLGADIEADVVVIGAGITGLTTALLLQRAGRSVALLEAHDRLGRGVTGATTAHITAMVDSRYDALSKRFGADTARAVAEGTSSAIDTIERLAAECAPDCEFERVTGYLYAETEQRASSLHDEFAAAGAAGLDVSLTHAVPLPFATHIGMKIDNQGQFHPVRYLAGLARAFVDGGGRLHLGTFVTDVRDGAPCEVETEIGHKARAQDVVMATHVPIGRDPLHVVLPPYRSYVLAFRSQSQAPGLFWDMDDPYHYTRSSPSAGGVLIVGGADHTVGEADESEQFDQLRAYAEEHFGISEEVYHWSAQWYQPTDDLPMYGRAPGRDHVWVITGLLGDGMTFGTLGAMIVSDRIAGRENPWAETYKPARLELATTAEFAKAGLEVAKNMIIERLKPGEIGGLDELAPGCGAVMRAGLQKVAVWRDESGEVRAYSATCPHLGCIVHYNTAEKSFDCPCHGSRFGSRGEWLQGPADRGLAPAKIEGA